MSGKNWKEIRCKFEILVELSSYYRFTNSIIQVTRLMSNFCKVLSVFYMSLNFFLKAPSTEIGTFLNCNFLVLGLFHVKKSTEVLFCALKRPNTKSRAAFEAGYYFQSGYFYRQCLYYPKTLLRMSQKHAK